MSFFMKRTTYPNILQNGVIRASFSREGGVSHEPYQSLNVSYHAGDSDTNIHTNRKKIKEALGIKYLVSGHQVHDDKVYCVREKPKEDYEIKGYDGFITNIPDIGLMIQQADCQAVMLYDPVQKAVGIAHAGWRGSVANIIAKIIKAMSAEYGTTPSDLQAAISPSLGPCCAEFVHYRTELPTAFHTYQVRENYFDFWAISRDQLRECGVRAENIEAAEICTVCNKDFFSYRRDKVTGRFASVIGLI
jgi:hypothetical protein